MDRLPMTMRRGLGWLVSSVAAAMFGAALPAAQTSSSATAVQGKPTFSVQVALVTTDVLVRDREDHFVPDLTKNDFEIYEDGVKQPITTMTLVHGGRVTNMLTLPPSAPPEGIL